MPFERFVKSGRAYRPTASIWARGGQIGLNSGAVQRFKISDYKFAVLYYDSENKRIGIKLTNDEDEPGVMGIVKGATGVFISAVSFLDNYNIDHEKTQKYAVDYNEDEGLFIIDLNKPFGEQKKSRYLGPSRASPSRKSSSGTGRPLSGTSQSSRGGNHRSRSNSSSWPKPSRT